MVLGQYEPDLTHGELKMTLRPFPMLIAMLLMLAIGVGLGVLITTSHRATAHAVVEAPQIAPPSDAEPCRQARTGARGAGDIRATSS